MIVPDLGHARTRGTRKSEVWNQAKILILTARAVPEKHREEFLQSWSDADESMYEPFDLEELLRRI